jgi:riboflavin kinase / FMN adenylyltransferase
MKIYSSLDVFPTPPDGSIVTVGNFDGVHRGHQTILQKARQIADAESLPLIAVTFNPAPVRILRPEQAPRLLSPLEIKTRLLQQHTVDQLIVLESTQQMLSLGPEEFAQQVLVEKLGVKHIVEGQTFSFGRRRTGTLVSLEEIGTNLGFQAHLVPSFTLALDETHSVAINSTLVRQQIMTGQVAKAAASLGRPYQLAGNIVRGKGRGRELGFPTANIKLRHPEQLHPEDGVYAGYAQLGEDFEEAWENPKRYRAAVSIGRCETFEDGQWQIEAFMLDYPENKPNLYGRCILLSMQEKIRDQQRFTSPQELTQAINADCQRIRQILAE